MTGTASIQSPQLLHIDDGRLCYGGDQEWYPTQWQRTSGCGPTTCSHLLWYLSRTRPGYEALCPHDASTKQGFLRLMEDVWAYVTPGRMGVHSPDIFITGAVRYAEDRGILLQPHVLQIPTLPGQRPSYPALGQYLAETFGDDLPVAFLNLSNGRLRNLDNWHWVTLVSTNFQDKTALMYDQRRRSELDLELWLKTTSQGGAFVALEPAQ